MLRKATIIIAQAFILAAVGSVIGLVVNFARPEGIDFLRSKPFEIYVPCPMMPKQAKSIQVQQLAKIPDAVIIDARTRTDYKKEHIPGSRTLPYNPLESPPPSAIEELKSLGPNRIIVVGDTEIDSGKLLASELSEAGCLGVRYIEGGFPAWKKAGRSTEKQEEP